MARSSNPNSAGSQFYICLGDAPFLNRQYTVFGHVVEGQNVVDQIRAGDQMTAVTIEGGEKAGQRLSLPRLALGTQGWSYPDWVGPMYDAGTRPGDYLARVRRRVLQSRDRLDRLRHAAARPGAQMGRAGARRLHLRAQDAA